MESLWPCGRASERAIRSSEVRFLVRTQNFHLSHPFDKKKKIFLYFFTELKTYHFSYSIYQHDAIDIADPSSYAERLLHKFVIIDLVHRRVSVARWWSIGARNPKILGSVPHGDSEFFLHLTLVTRRKSIFLYFFTELKTYHLCSSIYKHDAIDIAGHVNFVIGMSHRRVSVARKVRYNSLFLSNEDYLIV